MKTSRKKMSLQRLGEIKSEFEEGMAIFKRMIDDYLDIYKELSEIPLESVEENKKIVCESISLCQKSVEQCEESIGTVNSLIKEYYGDLI